MTPAPTRDLIFAHQGNARVAASVTMGGIVAVLIGGVFMTIGPPLKRAAPLAQRAGQRPAPVRIVGAAPAADVPCDRQVWPNIDQRCLERADAKRADQTAPPEPASAAAQDNEASAAAQDNDKLTPLTAASVDHAVTAKDDAAAGGGVPEDTAVLRQRDAHFDRPAPGTMAANDEDDEAPPAAPARRHHRHGFHLRFGPFRF